MLRKVLSSPAVFVLFVSSHLCAITCVRTAEMTAVLKSRLPLIVCCISSDLHLQTVAQYLQTNTRFVQGWHTRDNINRKSCVFTLSLCSHPSLSWQLLVQLYYANEKLIFKVDQPRPFMTTALEASSSSKVCCVVSGVFLLPFSRP